MNGREPANTPGGGLVDSTGWMIKRSIGPGGAELETPAVGDVGVPCTPEALQQALERVAELLRSQRLAVLATQNQGAPYGNLIAFSCTPDLRSLIFATPRATRKFSNLVADGRVALVIDSRSNEESDFELAMAVTATGRAAECNDDRRAGLERIYLEKHPYLIGFIGSPECALFSVAVEGYYVVTRFQEVVELFRE